MAKATWNGTVIAESDDIVVVEGNAYFPDSSLKREHFGPSEKHTVCGWKGDCSYYDVTVDGEVNRDAAWYYKEPKSAADAVRGRVAFWKGVVVEK